MHLPSNDPYLDPARKQAIGLIKSYNLKEPPVPVFDIAAKEGLEVLVADTLDSEIAGFIDVAKGRVILNQADSPERQAFVVAHELGHWLLHRQEIIGQPDLTIFYRRRTLLDEVDPQQQEANAFAVELLVPSGWLEKYDDQPVSEIAKVFGVTTEVIGYVLSWKT